MSGVYTPFCRIEAPWVTKKITTNFHLQTPLPLFLWLWNTTCFVPSSAHSGPWPKAQEQSFLTMNVDWLRGKAKDEWERFSLFLSDTLEWAWSSSPPSLSSWYSGSTTVFSGIISCGAAVGEGWSLTIYCIICNTGGLTNSMEKYPFRRLELIF